MLFAGDTPSGHQIVWDSGPRDAVTEGPTPMEALLHATAVCGAMDVVSILKKRRKPIERFEIEVEGERADEFPKVFTRIRITYRVSGDGITRTEVEKAMKLSREKYCSIVNMFKPDVEVIYELEMPSG